MNEYEKLMLLVAATQLAQLGIIADSVMSLDSDQSPARLKQIIGNAATVEAVIHTVGKALRS